MRQILLRALILLVLWAGVASAQPYRPPEPRDVNAERGLLVGLCLAAIEEVTRLNVLERHVLLPDAERECRAAPGPTLYKIKGGRVFQWRMPERNP